MDNDLKSRIERARELLHSVHHAAMATVNEDGSPHNTPFFFFYDKDLSHVYWASNSDSLHSQNILRTGQLFMVLYEANKGGGLYIAAEAGHQLAEAELLPALSILNQARAAAAKEPLEPTLYSDSSPQRLWSATPKHFWVNVSRKDDSGRILGDHRQEIESLDLLRVL